MDPIIILSASQVQQPKRRSWPRARPTRTQPCAASFSRHLWGSERSREANLSKVSRKKQSQSLPQWIFGSWWGLAFGQSPKDRGQIGRPEMLSLYFHLPKPNCLVKLLTCGACKNAVVAFNSILFRRRKACSRLYLACMAWNKLYCLHFCGGFDTLQLWIEMLSASSTLPLERRSIAMSAAKMRPIKLRPRLQELLGSPYFQRLCISLLTLNFKLLQLHLSVLPELLAFFWISESKCFQCLEATWLCQPLVSCLCENCTQTGQKSCIVHWGHYVKRALGKTRWTSLA